MQKTDLAGKIGAGPMSLSENSIVGPRASVFSPDKDGEAGDVGFIVDTAGCRQAENKPLEARSNSPTDSYAHGLILPLSLYSAAGIIRRFGENEISCTALPGSEFSKT
jgi:hypothetical protein